ncbi:hypothetical protein N5D50_03220 [Citrobacter portucalensis]|uniref:hypothetical protein n=1 Tax=Citrobacter portucalensis TaxID=1639133 RepID=UPI002449D832|nr:hypothetical protein [Citrobacter portucalensis]MDH1795233.1 hypothetical protein [Citrobacter portucalensis]
MLDFLGNKYFVALALPLILIFCGALIKKIVRSSGWRKNDFYLGYELVVSAIGAALVNVFDLSKQVSNGQMTAEINSQLVKNGGYLGLILFVLFVLMALHQDWENVVGKPKRQIFYLIGCGNLLGVASFASFVLWVKGV